MDNPVQTALETWLLQIFGANVEALRPVCVHHVDQLLKAYPAIAAAEDLRRSLEEMVAWHWAGCTEEDKRFFRLQKPDHHIIRAEAALEKARER